MCDLWILSQRGAISYKTKRKKWSTIVTKATRETKTSRSKWRGRKTLRSTKRPLKKENNHRCNEQSSQRRLNWTLRLYKTTMRQTDNKQETNNTKTRCSKTTKTQKATKRHTVFSKKIILASPVLQNCLNKIFYFTWQHVVQLTHSDVQTHKNWSWCRPEAPGAASGSFCTRRFALWRRKYWRFELMLSQVRSATATPTRVLNKSHHSFTEKSASLCLKVSNPCWVLWANKHID